MNEDESLTFSAAGGNAITIDDPDLDPDEVTVTLTIEDGALLLALLDGLASHSGNGTNLITLTGTLAAVNAALDGLTYTPPADANGARTLAVTARSDSNGESADPATIPITVDPVNDAPVVSFAPNMFAPVGAEALVNATTSGAQTNPAVGALADGGYLIAWVGPDASFGGIYAQRFAADGTAAGAEFAVHGAVANRQEANPQVVSLGSGGGFLVLWEDVAGDIYARRFDQNGDAVGAEFRVNTTAADFQLEPTAALLDDGSLVVAWQSRGQEGNNTVFGYGIYAQRFDASGAPLGGEAHVNSYTLNSQIRPSLSALADGGYVILWQSNGQDGSGYGIYGQRFASDGTPAGTEFQASTTAAGAQDIAAVAGLAGGGFVVAWRSADADQTGIFAQRFNAAGAAVGGEFAVHAASAGVQTAPVVAATLNGGFVIGWETVDSDGPGIAAQYFGSAGQRLGAEQRVNATEAGAQANPAIAILGNGDLVVSWQSSDGSGAGIYQQRLGLQLLAVENEALSLADCFAVTDVDAGAEVLVATLSVDAGTLSVESGSSGALIDGSGGTTVTITGTLAEINAVLAGESGASILFNTGDAPPGSTVLTLEVDDGGASGSGGPLTGSQSATIQIVQVNDAPELAAPLSAAVAEDGALAFTGTELISVADVDGWSGSYSVELSIADGALTLDETGLESAAGNGASALTISGSLAAVNAALATLTYAPPADANGARTLSVTASEVGGRSDTASVGVTISAVNDAPVALVASVTAADIEEDVPSATGATVAALFAAAFDDSKDAVAGGSSADSLAGIAIVDSPGTTAAGAWQYDAGGGWIDLPAADASMAILLATGTALRFLSAPDFAGEAPGLLVRLVESSGAAFTTGDTVDLSLPASVGGETAYSAATISLDQSVTAVNDAPVNTVPAGPLTTDEDVALVITGLSMADVDAADADLSVTLTVEKGILTLRNDVPGGVGAAQVSGNGTTSVTLTAPLAAINTTLAAAAALSYLPATDFNGPDLLTVTTDDGGASGGAALQDADSVAIAVAAVDDLPAAAPDPAATTEAAFIDIDVLANDADHDGGPKLVTTIQGIAVAPSGSVMLASGAVVTLNPDGTLRYDPDGRFVTLVSAATAAMTGAVNDSATDSFSYALNGGSSATVTVTIEGQDGPGSQLAGDSGDNAITGTGAGDIFNLSQGGADEVFGGGGDDGFYFGAALGAGDKVDGGAGSDQLALQGNYNLVLAADQLTSIEVLVTLSGSDTRFGGDGSARYDYAFALAPANVPAGTRLTINANSLLADEDLYISAATIPGSLAIFGGFGRDTLTGGSANDGFFFGDGRFSAADRINGRGGTDDQLGLRGDYSQQLVFAATTMVNIETIAVISASDTRFGAPGSAFSYNLRTHDANLAVGAQLSVNGAGLTAAETLIFDGSNETNGTFRLIAGAGADVLIGGAGADLLFGGRGADQLTGGAGADRFIYQSLLDSDPAARDSILDFEGADRIDLSAIDAVPGAGDQAFTFIGSAAFSAAGQVRATQNAGLWTVEADQNGDGIADLVIEVTLAAGAPPIDATSFIL